MIDAAMVGLGWWGQSLIESVQGKSHRLRFIQAATPRPSERAEIAQRLGVRLSSSLEEVIANPAVQAVVLATPHSLHVDQVEQVARAGKPVFCEKPLALTKADAQRAVDVCRRAGVVLAVGHNRRFMPTARQLKEAMERRTLGRILHLEAHSSNESARTSFAAWRARPGESPAGGMTGTGIHLLDLAVGMLGPVRAVFAHLVVQTGPPLPRDACTVVLEFFNGVSATLSMVQTTPRYWRMHAFGSDASLEFLNDEEMVLRRSPEAPQRTKLPQVDALRLELEAFADAIECGVSYPVSPDEMVWTSATFEAICRSLASHKVEIV